MSCKQYSGLLKYLCYSLSLGDGAIEPEELKTVLKACTAESSLSLSDDSIERLALALFEEADTDQNGEISFDEMEAVLAKHPDILENLNIR